MMPVAEGRASSEQQQRQGMRTVEQAHGADVGGLLLIAPLVEQAADLVHPALAHVALHPPFLRLLVVLPLLQLILRSGKTQSHTAGPIVHDETHAHIH